MIILNPVRHVLSIIILLCLESVESPILIIGHEIVSLVLSHEVVVRDVLPLSIINELDLCLEQVIIINLVGHWVVSFPNFLSMESLVLFIGDEIRFAELDQVVLVNVISHWVLLLPDFLSVDSAVLLISHELRSLELNEMVIIDIVSHRVISLINFLGVEGLILLVSDEIGFTNLNEVVVINIVSHWVLLLINLLCVDSTVLLVGHEIFSFEFDGLSDSEDEGDVCEFVHFIIDYNFC